LEILKTLVKGSKLMKQSFRSPDGRNHTLWDNIDELLEALIPAFGSRTPEQRKERGWFFRGQSDARWDLAPTLYRKPCTASDIDKRKQQTETFVNALRENAEKFGLTQATEDELVAIAQHYGFPTAHLDFTYNMDVAAYFSTASNPTQADVGVIYGFNVKDYQEMCNPFAVWGISQEDAEEQMREGGLTPLPPLKVVHLDNIQRILKQEALFIEVHEHHLDTLMENCIERFYFKQSPVTYSGGVQPYTWSLPPRSSFANDFEYARFMDLAKSTHPELFESTPYVGQGALFPEDDELHKFASAWKQENQELEPAQPVNAQDGPNAYAIPQVKIVDLYPAFQSLLPHLPYSQHVEMERIWQNIPGIVEGEYIVSAREQGVPGKWQVKLKHHICAAWELNFIMEAEKIAQQPSTPKSWVPFAARLWDMSEAEVTAFDFETQRPDRHYFRGALPLRVVAAILRRAMPELLDRVSLPPSMKEEILGFDDDQMLRGPHVQLVGMLADRFLDFLTDEERWDLWVTMVVPVGTVFALDHTKPFLNPNSVYRCGFP
jgi:hypothetical protein